MQSYSTGINGPKEKKRVRPKCESCQYSTACKGALQYLHRHAHTQHTQIQTHKHTKAISQGSWRKSLITAETELWPVVVQQQRTEQNHFKLNSHYKPNSKYTQIINNLLKI